MKIGRLLLRTVLLLSLPLSSFSQTVSVKTNLLYDICLVPSLGAEVMLSDRWSLSAEGSWMPLRQASRHFWRTYSVQPSLRYWAVARMAGPFVGGCYQFRGYNLGGLPFSHLRDSRSQGTMQGAGIQVGWHQMLSDRWSLEAQATGGYSHLHYLHFDAPRSYAVTGSVRKDYVGLLDLGVSIVYIIR